MQAQTRPRSPEGKARAPQLKQPLGTGLGRAVPGGGALPLGTASAPLSGGSQLPGRGSPQPGITRRNTSNTVEEIKRIDANREQRRKAAEEVRRSRQEEAALLGAQCGGNVPDIDFHRMIRDFRSQCPSATKFEPVDPGGPDGIVVCVRKRPIQQHEIANRELDCVTACNPFAIVHERKFKVDGITKCLESHQFEFDRVFDEDSSTDDVYSTVAQPLVPWIIEAGGRATLFAYGQTGSGKTHTMTGIQKLLSEQLFEHIRNRGGDPLEISLSFFEIYGGRPYDLLNNRQRLETLEDARNEVQIAGLTERAAATPEAMLQCIELGNSLRTTHATAINPDSSRSHAVCAVFLRSSNGGSIHAKITLVDLAGSERAADSKSSIRQRRVEGAQINKSLLALKECIRAMGDPREAHVPFRASKLTLVLRDAFVSRCPSRTVMIACISPGMMSADHSVNTLRYSDRLKDHRQRGGTSTHIAASDDLGGDGLRKGHSFSSSIVRDAKSPEPRLASRRRSPSPAKAEPTPPAPGPRPRTSSGVADIKDLMTDDEDEEADEVAQPVHAWGEETAQADGSGLPSSAVAGSSPPNRQPAAQRGRQPQHRPREAHPPARQENHGTGAGRPGPVDRGSSGPLPPSSQPSGHAVREPYPRAEASASSGQAPARPVRDRSPITTPAQERGGSGRIASDPSQEDNRYLHNTLTSEVYERHAGLGGGGVVDVGVEDLADLAHMEVVDEVRQWEDRIVSQHMVALQEDARLLTKESELLSQVQQGASYDIDWYVSEVDKVVRRKMEVYAGFLEDLEAFKAQLRREESLSRSCQRGRAGQSSGGRPEPEILASHHTVSAQSPRTAARDSGFLDATPQRTPRTPRTAGGSGALGGAYGMGPR